LSYFDDLVVILHKEFSEFVELVVDKQVLLGTIEHRSDCPIGFVFEQF